MNGKALSIILLSVAVISLAAALIVRNVKRAETARALAEVRASEEEIAVRESRKAEAETKAREAAARAAVAKAAATSNETVRVLAEQKLTALEAAAERAAADKAAADKATAQENARAAADAAAKAKAEADAKREEAKRAAAEAAKARALAEAEADRLATAKAKAEAAETELKLLELRKIDFETAERELAQYRQELDERERELRPEATIYNSSNITWVAEREPDVIGETGTVKRTKAVRVRPEDDISLPAPTRRLAKCDRVTGAQTGACLAAASNTVVTVLENQYRQARAEGRVIDADFYAKSIRLFYPHWKPALREKGKEQGHGE